MGDLQQWKKKLNCDLKLHGIIIRSEFCSHIIESLNEAGISLNDKAVFDDCVKVICDSLEKYIESDKSIEREHIDKAIETCIQSGYDESETKFNVIGAFDFPKLSYNFHRKLYFLDKKKEPSLILANPNSKALLFMNRYNSVLQRTQRGFASKNIANKTTLSLHTVDYLLTVSEKRLEHNLILGCLMQGSSGKYFLEDSTGMIQLDLKHAKYHGGFFYENCFVLANGYYNDKVLQVSTLILPPGEEFAISRKSFGNFNYFGGSALTLLRDSVKLEEFMNTNSHGMMIFLSDIWLDKQVVFEKLEVLFEGFSEMPPIAFIFMGNFLSQCYASETMTMLHKYFKQLAELLHKYTDIMKYSQFVFIPGINDPSMRHIIPRMPLPKMITQDFKKLVPNSTFTTNPCRIQYCSREIVVFRSDILCKLMQESLNKPSKDKIDDYLTKTIISQGHLSPFSLNVQPVHWSFDYTLQLYPLPNLIVIGDKANPYASKYKGCSVINPGSFLDSGCAFKSYTPATDTVDDCSL